MKRVVTELPLKVLISPSAPLGAERKRDLAMADIAELLRGAAVVQFIIADVGLAPMEIPRTDCHNFWKKDVKPHLPISDRINLDAFSGGYCYVASEWGSSTEGIPIVVLEKLH